MEGWGHNATSGCVLCGRNKASYRCQDCFTGRLLCQLCMLKHHQEDLLHVIKVFHLFQPCLLRNSRDMSYQVWTTTHFQKTSLSALRLQFQLGHPHNTPCVFQQQAHKYFVVIHNNGFHSVNLYYCNCQPGYAIHQQLLDNAWFLSTPLEPRTCGTFAVLHHFHTLNLQVNTTSYDLYTVLTLLTVRATPKPASSMAHSTVTRALALWAHT